MSKTRMGKRVASLLLSLVMMLSLLPTTVYATEDTGGGTGATYDAVQQTESGDNTENAGELESTGEGEDDSEAGNKAETYVAQVGDVQYKTLEEAIGVAADGATVSLLDNVTLNTTLTVAKSITIDVGGFTLTVATDGDGIVVNNATLTLTGTGKYVFNCTASGSDGIFVNNTVEGGTSELNLNGNVDINVSGNVSSAIHAYASAGKAVVNINAGTITARGSKQFPGVVVDQNATLNMTGGTFDLSMDFDAYSDGNDVVGVLIWGGSSHKQENCAVNISGGTFKVGGKNAFAQAVQVGMSNGYSENCTVNISGGNVVLNPTEGGKGYVYTAYKASYATAAITGGTVSGKVTAIANTYIRDLENDGLTITGGTFSGITVDEKYLAEGKTLDKSGTVIDEVASTKPVTVNGVGYDTLEEAIAAAQDGDTVTLLADVEENVEIAAGKNLTLDLNGCTLNGGTGTNKAALTNYGTITITDSSEAKTGTIKRNDIGTVGETSYYVILNQGTMTIESGNVINNSGYKKANSTGSMVGSSLICNGDCNGGSTLTINGGTFTQYNFIAIKNGALGVLNVTGGMITSNHSAIQNWFEANITGGEIKGQLWTDAYTAGVSDGKTKIGGNATFTGEIVMDIYGNSVAPTLEIAGGKLDVTNWKITDAAANVGAKPAISGGTFKAAVPADYLADGFEIKESTDASGNTTYGVEKAASYVAMIGEQSYATLQAAFDAAKTGDTVTLLSDITLTEQVNITKALDGLTLDGNGKTITCATTNDPSKSGGSALYFGNADQHLYCTGIKIKDLTMTGTARFAIFLCGGTTTEFTNVNISGNYYIAVNLYGTHGATMTNCNISNSTTGTDKYISGIWSNVSSANPLKLVNSTVDVITINTYTTANKLEPKIFVMDGSEAEIHTFDDGSVSGNKKLCVSTESTGTYTIKEYDETTSTWVEVKDYVAEVNGTGYATLAAAYAAAEDGATVTLLADTTEDVTINKNITLDLGGKTLTNTNTGKATLTIAKGATATVKNGSVVGGSSYYTIQNNGTATLEGVTATAGNTGSSMIDNWGTLTIESGTYEGGLNVVKSEEGSTLTINGGKFTLEYATEGYTGVVFAYGNTTITGGEFIQNLTTTGRWNHPTVILTGVVEGYTAITRVTGGHFVNKMSGESIFRGAGKGTSDNFEVSGGTFNKSVPDSFFKEGYFAQKNTDGTYGVGGPAVAKVNSAEGYNTLAEAIAAAKAGETVTLLQNVTVDKPIIVGKAITLDLGGKTLTSTWAMPSDASGADRYALVNNAKMTLTNGTFAAGEARAIGAYAGLTLNNVTVSQTLTGGHACVAFCKDGATYTIKDSTINGAYAVANFANNATIKITGSELNGSGCGLYHNGSNYGLELTVRATTINGSLDGAIGNENDPSGVYISGSTATVEKGGMQFASFTNCTIKGATAIEVKYTNLKLDKCTVEATAKTPSYSKNNNGMTALGFAVVSTDNSKDGVTPVPAGTVTITGKGNYTGLVGLGALEGVKETYTGFADGTIKVFGGTFDSAVMPEYCADGFVPTQNDDGTYGVREANYVAQVSSTKYESLAAAIEAAGRNATVTLLADTRENVTIDKAMTLDLNGHTLNGGTEKGKPALTITARPVTIKDSSEAQNGTIMREDTAENSGVSSHYVIDVQGNGWLTFEGGNVKNGSGVVGVKGASLVRVGDDSVAKQPGLVINGGTFTQDNFIVIKVDRGYLKLNGGTLNSANSYAVENWYNANIKGGTVNGDVAAWTYSGGTNSFLTIEGGAINGNVTSVNYGNAENRTAKVSITGGTVNGELDTRSYDPATNELTSIDDAAKATIKVTSGTFSKDPSTYVVEDSAVKANEDGTFGVEKAYLAKVGDTSYYTMKEAFEAQTASGAPIVMLRDYTTGSPFRSGSINRTVDLNGHTWTCTGTDANSAAFEINNSNVTLTVKSGKVVSSQLVGLIPSAIGGTITYDNSGLVFESVEMKTTAHSGIETNGNNKNNTVTLKNSTLNVPNGFGIYFPSSGTLNIENSIINAKTMGVQVCSGSLNINDGSEITVTGDPVEKTENDGAIQDGAAISIVNRTGYKGLDKIKVTGGTFTAKTGNDAIKAYDWNNTNRTEDEWAEAGTYIAVSGGTFSSAVKEEYCADGYIPTANGDGTYGVKEGQYVAYVGTSTNKFETLQAAINAAKDSQTVRLLADITLTETAVFPAGKKVSINLQGHKITATGTALRINGTTEINSSKTGAPDAAQTGMIVSTNNVAVAVGNNAKLSVFSGTLKGREGAVITGTSTGATIDVRGSKATLIATDNAVIAGNGSKRDGDPNNITIRNGTFIGSITTPGYIACGIYAPWNDNVTVSGGTFNITNGAGIVARAGTVKVTSGTFNCTGDGTGWVGDSKNTVPCAALVFDKAANYPALTDASQILVSGGSFSTDPAANGATLAAGYVAAPNESGMYKVEKANPVAEINGVKYDTLSQAIAALEDKGGTIKLLQDINAPSMNYKITENITIDLNGHDITGSGAEGVFYVYTSGHLTITGDGVITAVENNKAAIAVQVFSEKAKVTLEGGTYKQQITNKDDPHFDLIYVYYGTAEIKGGTYEGFTPAWTLNCRDDSYKAGTAHITVTGGTFVGFDPANNTAEGEGTSFVPTGYVPKANGDGSYTVVKGTYVAEYNGTKYTSLQEAINAASQKNGGQAVVTLLGDLTITETVNFAKQYGGSVLLNLGGYTLTGEGCRALQINKGNLYLENGTVTSTGIINSSSVIRIGSNEDAYSGVQPQLYMRNGAKVLAPVSYGVTIFGSKTVSEQLTVAGNASIEATGPSPAISGQGGQAYHVDGKGTKVIITGNAVVSATNNYAIYHPDNGTLTVQGNASVSGKGGIQMCSGTLDISYGSPKIEALGKADHETGAAGPIYDVAAISVVNRSYPGGAPVVTIKGTPTITAVDGEVIHAYTWSSGAESEWAEAGDNINVSGGTYSKDFKEAYLAADCTLVPNGDTTYTVKQEPVAEYNGTQYTSLAQALQDARNAGGGEVKLLKDVTQTTSSLDIGKVTLDLNTKTLTLDGGAQLYTSNAATIKNGTIKRTDEPTSGNANDFAIQVMSGSSLTLGTTSADTVTIESTYGVYNVGGTLTVGHANITTDGWSVAVDDSASKTGVVTIGEGAVITSKTGNCISTRVGSKPNVTITGGQLTSNGTNWDAGVIYWASEGTLTITGGTFTASSAEGSEAAAVYQKNGTVKISGSATNLLGNKALVVQTGDGSTGTMVTELSGGTYSTKPEEAWVVNGYRAIENTDGSFTVVEGKFTVQVTSRTVSSDTPVANVSGGGETTYEVGTTVTAASLSGYTFKGWYLEKYTDDNSTLVKTDLSFTYHPTADCTLIAVYEPISGAKFYLTVNASEFTVGESAVYDSYMHDQVAAGESVTVRFEGKENFLYWVNASRKVVSISKEYTFIMGSETTLTAVYGKTREAQATVVFMSDSDQIITSKAYKSGTAIQFPTPPIKMGCTFTRWSMTEQEIQAAIAASNNGVIVVKACYTDPSTPYTVTVRYPDDTKEEYSGMVGKTVTLTAKEISGKIFSYWTDSENNVLGYAKTLMLAPSGSITVKAVYSDTAVEAKPVITMTAVEAGEVGTGYYVISFTATRAVPEGYTVVKQGILYSVDSQCSGEGAKDYMKLTDEGSVPAGIYEYEGNNTALSGVTRFNAKTGAVDRTIYGRGYMVLKNSSGTIEYVYSDNILSGNYSNLANIGG